MKQKFPPSLVDPRNLQLYAGDTIATVSPHWGGSLNSLKVMVKDEYIDIVKPMAFPKVKNPGELNAWIHGGIPILFPFAGRVYFKGDQGKYSYYK